MLIGFARASRCGPPLTDQRAALVAAGCNEVVEIGARGAANEALGHVMARLGPGDALVVVSLDRLPGSMTDVASAARDVVAAGATLRVLTPPVQLNDDSALLFLEAAAGVERDRRAERQSQGIDAKRAAGGYTKGRPKAADPNAIRAALASGEGPSEISTRLGIGRSTVYRLAAQADEPVEPR